MYSKSVSSLYFVGGKDGDDASHDEILELVDGEWRQVAIMQTARYGHAVSLINLDTYWNLCK